METVIDKTVTWVPVTVTFEFAAVPSQAPSPGVGKIGMGDLSKGMEIKETGTAARGGENAAPTMGVGMGVSGVLWVMVGMGIGMF